jgi:glutathione-specific gamma-glutamylcyclotransferase
MWIFGYGSLMFDGWESDHGCVERRWVDLAGYRRVFNKKSVENWVTKERPGLTLNLKESATSLCRGVAFAFADDDSTSQGMLKCLTKREACQPRSLAIRLQDGRDVSALVYIYEGKNILDPTTPMAEMASMVVSAKGKSGACVDYVGRTFEGLGSIGLDDPEVTSLWEAVKNHTSRTNLRQHTVSFSSCLPVVKFAL